MSYYFIYIYDLFFIKFFNLFTSTNVYLAIQYHFDISDEIYCVFFFQFLYVQETNFIYKNLFLKISNGFYLTLIFSLSQNYLKVI